RRISRHAGEILSAMSKTVPRMSLLSASGRAGYLKRWTPIDREAFVHFCSALFATWLCVTRRDENLPETYPQICRRMTRRQPKHSIGRGPRRYFERPRALKSRRPSKQAQGPFAESTCSVFAS